MGRCFGWFILLQFLAALGAMAVVRVSSRPGLALFSVHLATGMQPSRCSERNQAAPPGSQVA